MYKGSYRDSNYNIYDGFNDDEVALRNLDGFERILANAYRLADELNRKRFYLEHRLINAQTNNLPNVQQTAVESKDQNSAFTKESVGFSNQQNQLKRAIDPIGGANLLKRAVDRIGGGNLLKRR